VWRKTSVPRSLSRVLPRLEVSQIFCHFILNLTSLTDEGVCPLLSHPAIHQNITSRLPSVRIACIRRLRLLVHHKATILSFPLWVFFCHTKISQPDVGEACDPAEHISRLRFRAQPNGAVTRNALNVNGMPHPLMPLSCTEATTEGIMRSCLLLAGAICLREIISRP